MFSIDQLGYFKESNPLFKIVKPWWDVFTDYIAAAMLALAVLAGVMQATSGHLYCLPTVHCSSSINQSTPAFGNNIYCKDSGNSSMLIKLQDRGQYDFVHAECKKKAVHWFVSYFPFIIFLETVLLMVVSNFWLKIPKTLYVVEHFVTLVNDCYNTPGTSLVVCNTLWQTKNSDYYLDGDGQQQNTESTEPLEISEANKAKTLQEKVRTFRDHVEERSNYGENNKWHKIMRYIYLIQELIKLVLSLVSLVFNAYHHKLDDIVNCTIPYVFSKSYNHFTCSNVLVPFFQLVFWIFFIMIVLYCVLCIYAFLWTFLKIRRNKYDFHKRLSNNKAKQLGNVNPVRGDLAFMLYLLDKYNELYSDRFAVFLSNKDGKKLKDYILANDWPIERLLKETVDCERTLKLSKLGGIPKTVFEMLKLGKLDKLILESCKFEDDDFNREDWLKVRLRSLSLKECSLTEIPLVIFELSTLESLYLDDNNIQSIPRNIQDLKQLKIFDISDNNITEGVEHILTMKNLTANLCGNQSLELGYSNDQLIELMRLYIHEGNIKDKAKPAFENIARRGQMLEVPVVKYSPNQTPEIKHENFYTMTPKSKGLVLLFSIVSDRNARAILEDYMHLNSLFGNIGYKVNDYYDKLNANNTVNDFKKKISDDLNEYTYDSIIIVFSGSGTKEGMYLNGGEFMSVETIVDILKNINSLRGKPKLIINQTWMDPTVNRENATDKEAQECLPEYTLNVDRPACDDVVIAYSTLQSCISPSWFVRALIDVFSYYAWKEDVLSLLKRVNDELYRKCIVRKAYKHVSPPQSTLTKKWYLFPGFPKPDDSGRSQPSTSTSYKQDESNV